jgi:Ca-activated chloride channel family protein
VPPIDAAKVAAHYGIRIYTIAIGDPASVGDEALDIETIARISEVADGQYFQALDREQLQQAYSTIDALEPELYETVSYRPRQSLHWVPVATALVLYWIYHSWSAWRAWRRTRSRHAV